MRRRITVLRLASLFAILGPGIINASSDNDAPGITTYSLAGARFGLSLLWVLIPVTISLAVTAEMGARMGAVTGKGLGAIIRERFGARWAAFAILVMLIANFGTTAAEFAGISTSLGIFGMSRYLTVPIGAIAVWILITKFDYKRVHRVFLVSSALYFTYVASGFLAKPDWSEVLRSFLRPSFSSDGAYILMVIAIIGTTVTPWGQFFIQSYTADKRARPEDLPYLRADVYIGAVFVSFIAFFIILACAATIHRAGLTIDEAADAARALTPLAGKFASMLFAFGLLNASLLGAAILPLTSAYATCDAFGWESGLDKTFREAPMFFGLFTFFIAAPSLVVLIPHLPLLQILFLPQVLNGILLPIILVFVVKASKDPEFMGRYTNSRWFNAIAIITAGVLIVLTLLLLMTPLVARASG